MSEQLARELEQEFAQEDQAVREQVERDAKIVKIQVKEDLRQMINELDRSNEMINKHMAEYKEAKNDLTIEEKTELIIELIKWKTKDFKGMTFEQIKETFIPVWESIQDFVPMDSKEKSEKFKRPGTLLEKMKVKRLKTDDGLAQEQQFKEVKEKESDD
ncbi:hypothetical protein Tco_0136860 [Tanacetum coccineum]